VTSKCQIIARSVNTSKLTAKAAPDSLLSAMLFKVKSFHKPSDFIYLFIYLLIYLLIFAKQIHFAHTRTHTLHASSKIDSEHCQRLKCDSCATVLQTYKMQADEKLAAPKHVCHSFLKNDLRKTVDT